MAFQPEAYDAKYLAAFEADGQACNEAAGYGARVVEAVVPDGQACWRVIGVHHLTPDENQGRHHVYLQALDENGVRYPKAPRPVYVKWTWQGRRYAEEAPPAALDKQENEPGGNIAIASQGQTLTIWAAGFGPDEAEPSDLVLNLNTRHPDELGPGGETWNSWGHHSYYVVFQRRQRAAHGMIRGSIVNGRGYRVRLMFGDRQIAEQVADANGAFAFRGLGQGSYRVEATSPTVKTGPIQLQGPDDQVTVELAAPNAH